MGRKKDEVNERDEGNVIRTLQLLATVSIKHNEIGKLLKELRQRVGDRSDGKQISERDMGHAQIAGVGAETRGLNTKGGPCAGSPFFTSEWTIFELM